MTILHEWSFAGYVCRIVETEPGIVHFEQAQESRSPLPPGYHLAFNRTEKPLGCANEIIHLSQALAEANVINRDLSKAIQGWQEDRNRREREIAALPKIASLALSLAHEFEVAVASREPVRGMQVPPSSDFLACAQLPSAVKRMAWWAREIRKACAPFDQEET